jgi:hypothetical protein
MTDVAAPPAATRGQALDRTPDVAALHAALAGRHLVGCLAHLRVPDMAFRGTVIAKTRELALAAIQAGL